MLPNDMSHHFQADCPQSAFPNPDDCGNRYSIESLDAKAINAPLDS
jgi:hypothetical protein